jgi:hypothetical protein
MRRKLGDIAYGRERQIQRRALLVAAQAVAEQHQDKDFTAAVVTGVLTTEAVAYRKREAAGQALRKVADEVLALSERLSQKISRTLGAYHGFMLCVQAHPYATAPDVFLALEQHGTVTPVCAYPVKCETDIGVFASADSQIRGIAESIGRLDAELERMDQEEMQITAALELPWEQAARYAQLQTELEALNTELAKTDQPEPATTPECEANQQITPAIGSKLEIVAVSDADVLEQTAGQPVAPTLRLPPVALPKPSDLAAMDAAVACLATLDAVVVENEIEAEIEAETSATEAEVLELPITISTPQPMQLDVALRHQDVIRQPRASRSALVFGSCEHIKQVRGKKTAKTAKPAPGAATTDLFAAETTPQQLALTLF